MAWFAEINVDQSSREDQQKSVIENTFDVCIDFLCKAAVKKAPFSEKCLSRSLEAAKNTFVRSIVDDSTKDDNAVIIVFFKRSRRSRNKLFTGSSWESPVL